MKVCDICGRLLRDGTEFKTDTIHVSDGYSIAECREKFTAVKVDFCSDCYLKFCNKRAAAEARIYQDMINEQVKIREIYRKVDKEK